MLSSHNFVETVFTTKYLFKFYDIHVNAEEKSYFLRICKQ